MRSRPLLLLCRGRARAHGTPASRRPASTRPEHSNCPRSAATPRPGYRHRAPAHPALAHGLRVRAQRSPSKRRRRALSTSTTTAPSSPRRAGTRAAAESSRDLAPRACCRAMPQMLPIAHAGAPATETAIKHKQGVSEGAGRTEARVRLARAEGGGLLLPGSPHPVPLRCEHPHHSGRSPSRSPPRAPRAPGVCQRCGTHRSNPTPASPAPSQPRLKGSAQKLALPWKTVFAFKRNKQGKKDFQVPPYCNDFSSTYSLSSPKIEELFKNDARRKKELNRGKRKEKMEPQGGGEKQNEKTAKVKKRDEE